MRAHRRGVAALCACALVLALASGGEPDEEGVLITQGTNPRVEGLSIGLASVGGDEARMMIARPEQQAELITARVDEIVEVGDYTVEIFEVETDEGGSVPLKVTSPQADL